MFRTGSNARRLGGLAWVLSVLLAPHTAHAQDVQVASLQGVEIASFVSASPAAAPDAMLDPATPIEAVAPAPALKQPIVGWRASSVSWRSDNRAMFPLYAGQIGLQILDVHSTTRALNSGSTERNAVMSGVAGSPAALLFVKAGATTAMIYLIEAKVRKKSRVAAMAAMVGVNTAYALVVAHNYRAAR